MAKQKVVYAPGELAKTRGRLGSLDKEEAQRMTRVLGGEIGYERSLDQEAALNVPKSRKTRNETVEVNIGGRPRRRVEAAGADGAFSEEEIQEYLKRKAQSKKEKENPADDPAVHIKPSYWDRVKMDKYCGQPEFEIKSATQVMISVLSILNDPADNVDPAFINRRMNDYYRRIEVLVTSVRTLLPRNNLKRNERLKKASPFAFAVLDTFRYWNIDQISTDLSRLQARPRNVKIIDFIEIIRNIYRPLYILEKLDPEIHIKESFKLLYKVLFLESPANAKEKGQELIRTALLNYGIVRQEIRYRLYPLLMKFVSHCWLPYESFFQERKNRIKAFLQVTEQNRISPQTENVLAEEGVGETAGETKAGEKQPETRETAAESAADGPEAGTEAGAEAGEEQTKKQTREPEGKVLERGFSALEMLFPKAGWDRVRLWVDLYPYFSDVFKLRQGVELIAPTDPLQQVYFLSLILRELFFGLRHISFGLVEGADGSSDHLEEPMARIINEWQEIIETGFDKEYLSRLVEYCRLVDKNIGAEPDDYSDHILSELHWIKRRYFLPYHRFNSIMPTNLQKQTVKAMYPAVRSLRRYLSAIAGGIDQGNRKGGAEGHVPCEGIDNPWEPYVFEVPNPVSKRLDMLLAPKKRNNASLIFFTLAVTIVLDYLLNDENSWAYEQQIDTVFRSENGEGIRPLFGVDGKIDTETLFKQVLKKRQAAAAPHQTQH